MERPAHLASLTLERYETEFRDRELLHRVVDYWAERKPRACAFHVCDRNASVTWEEFREATRGMASRLLAIGYRRGDFLVTSLPFTREHILLGYACFRIGVIHVPLDLRLRPAEVLQCLKAVRPKTYISTVPVDAVFRRECPSVERWLAVLPGAGFGTLENTAPVRETELKRAEREVDAGAAAQAIFTTGSTGSPKPALLSHHGITAQNMALGAAFGFGENTRFLVNLPPSHVGGQAEALMTTLFYGGTAFVLESFDALKTLNAIQEHRIHMLGMIPAMFQYLWRSPAYGDVNLSSLQAVIYGGQEAPPDSLRRMRQMAPRIGTGLGLTESSGFCTYTPLERDPAEMEGTLGFDTPLYPMSIRAPMTSGGTAGEELPEGETGFICFRGPQTFLGYAGNPEATAQTLSTDGYLYTGDLGSVGPRGLRLSGRAKWVIKPAGHQVFPGDIEAHYRQLPCVASCAALGAEHRTLGEAVVLFVELKPGAQPALQEFRAHARGIASYMRPLHYVFLDPGCMPYNRAAKTDYLALAVMLREEIARLRELGRWDS